MAQKTLRSQILVTMLIMTLSCVAVMGAVFIAAIERLGSYTTESAKNLGDEAQAVSAAALEAQLESDLIKFAEDASIIIEENLIKIEDVSILLAETVTAIYSNSGNYKGRGLPVYRDGQNSALGEAYVHAMPAIDLERIRAETALVSNCSDVMRFLGRLPTQAVYYIVAGESGYIISMDKVPAPVRDYNAAQRGWYQLAKNSGQLVWTDIYVDIRGRGLLMSCASPFYDVFGGQKAFKGVASCGISITKFEEIIAQANIWRESGKTYVFLLDKNGKKLFASDGTGARVSGESILSESYIENERFRDFAQRMIRGESGFMRTNSGGGNSGSDYVAWHPLRRFSGRLGWSVGIYFDGSEITGKMKRLSVSVGESTLVAQKTTNDTTMVFMIVLITIAVFVIGMAIFLVFRFAEKITRPVIELGDAALQLGGGNLNISAEITTDTEELSRLAMAINGMSANIKAYVKNLAGLTAESRRVSSDFYIARSVQNAMLPQKFPGYAEGKGETGGAFGSEDAFSGGEAFPIDAGDEKSPFDIYAVTKNSYDISGDFYDFFVVNVAGTGKRIVFFAGRALGSGIPAALVMAEAKTLLRSWLIQGNELDTALNELNARLCEQGGVAEVSIWAACIPLKTDSETIKMQFVNAGHAPPFMRTAAHVQTVELRSLKTAAGSNDEKSAGANPENVYRRLQISLHSGDVVFLYTDGLREFKNTQGVRYDTSRIKKIIDDSFAGGGSGVSMRELISRVNADISDFIGNCKQESDVTLLGFMLK